MAQVDLTGTHWTVPAILRPKLAADAGLLVLLLLLMAYDRLGSRGALVHELLGIAAMLLAAWHLLLNRLPHRFAMTAAYYWLARSIRWLLGAAALAACISGIFVSEYLLQDFAAVSFTESARAVHLVSSHWTLLLAGVHTGLHLGMFRWLARGLGGEPAWKALRCAVLAAGLAGLAAFVAGGSCRILLGLAHFAFADYSEPLCLFLARTLSFFAAAAVAGSIAGVLAFRSTERTIRG